jgi:hypothetical protein
LTAFEIAIAPKQTECDFRDSRRAQNKWAKGFAIRFGLKTNGGRVFCFQKAPKQTFEDFCDAGEVQNKSNERFLNACILFL